MASTLVFCISFYYLQVILLTYEQQLHSTTQGKCLISFSCANIFHALLGLVQQFHTEESVL